MFTQLIDPLDNLTLTCLVALVPVVSLLILLAVFRWPAWLATLVAGGWGGLEAESVVIPATMGIDRGVWYRVREGIRGVVVRDEEGRPVVFVLCEPASHYYQVMTRSNRMPVLIQERI